MRKRIHTFFSELRLARLFFLARMQLFWLWAFASNTPSREERERFRRARFIIRGVIAQRWCAAAASYAPRESGAPFANRFIRDKRSLFRATMRYASNGVAKRGWRFRDRVLHTLVVALYAERALARVLRITRIRASSFASAPHLRRAARHAPLQAERPHAQDSS